MFARGTIFINALDTIDCALFDHEHGIVGQSWYLDVQAQGRGDENYFVSDFKKLKQKIRNYVRRHLDHRLLVPSHPAVRRHGQTWKLGEAERAWTYTCPPTAVRQLPALRADRVSVTRWLNTALQQHVGEELRITASLRESAARAGLCFHYTHGLPGHAGNCQRLLHGHRGRVQVRAKGGHGPRLEDYLARKILPRYVHFLNSQHITARGKQLSLAYESSQGYFAATFPPRHAIILPAMESSIEAITHYLAAQLRQHITPTPKAEIICYEGLDKGARCLL